MPTWAALAATVQTEVNDDGTFHPTAQLKVYLQHAELLLSMGRGLVEANYDLTLAVTWRYAIHTVWPELILPLRVTVGGKTLEKASLQAVGLRNANWAKTPGEPDCWFMIGGTYLVLYPIPYAGTATMTGLIVPSTAGGSPTIKSQWRQWLLPYTRAIAMAKEGQTALAVQQLKMFLEFAKLREPRLLNAVQRRGLAEAVIIKKED